MAGQNKLPLVQKASEQGIVALPERAHGQTSHDANGEPEHFLGLGARQSRFTQDLQLGGFHREAARVEVALMQMGQDGDHTLLRPTETFARLVTTGRVYERMWEYLTAGDPELLPA